MNRAKFDRMDHFSFGLFKKHYITFTGKEDREIYRNLSCNHALYLVLGNRGFLHEFNKKNSILTNIAYINNPQKSFALQIC